MPPSDYPVLRSFATLVLLTTASPHAFAQTQPPASAIAASDSEAPQEQGGAAPGSETSEDVIVVQAPRSRGSVNTNVPAVATLDANDIASYGASSLEELLRQLTPQTGSARGRGSGEPVVLVNGQRVSGFRAIRDLPPEAIEKVEVFPEEVALSFGFRPDQRVINFVLKDRFVSVAGEIEHGLSTSGGFGATEIEGTFTRLGKSSRLNIDVEYGPETALRESERGIVQPLSSQPFALGGNIGASPFVDGAEIDPALSAIAGRPVSLAGVPAGITGTPGLADFTGAANLTNLGEFRTLIPSSDRIEANATYSRTLPGNVTLQLNANYETQKARSLLGLNTASLTVPEANPFSPFSNDVTLLTAFAEPRALTRVVKSDTFALGFDGNGAIGGWRWTFTGNYSRNDIETLIDQRADVTALQSAISAANPADAINPFTGSLGSRLSPLAIDRATSLSEVAEGQLTVTGTLFELPAGPVTTTFNTGARRRTLETSDSRAGAGLASLARTELSVGATVDVPLVDRYDTDWFGALSINGNLGFRDFSDVGGLTEYGFGLNWSPVQTVSLQISFIGEEAAPGIQQLGNPQIITPNVPTFDLARNETVLATIISGGNPLLTPEERRDVKVTLNYSPPMVEGLDLLAEFIRNRSFGTSSNFPVLNPEIEAAFPDRIVRDTDGALLSIDQRPVNYAQISGDRLRYGLNFSKRIGGGEGGGRPGGRAGGFGGGGPRGGGERPGGTAAQPAQNDANAPGQPAQGQPAQGQQGQTAASPAGGATAAPPAAPPGSTARGGGGRGRGPGGGFGGRGGRWNVSLYHTVRFTETILIRPGVPELDLLGGSATGDSGGVPRHSVELEGGLYNNGFGFRLTGNYQSGSTVDGGGLPGATDLKFNDIATLGARVFLNFDNKEKLINALPFLKGSRLRLSIDNIFNAQQRVTNGDGEVPLRFQPGFIDPRGRFVSVSFRKRF